MRKTIAIAATVLFIALAATADAQQKDTAGCKDHPLFTRMPGYWIRSCAQKQFDARTFSLGNGKKIQVEGQSWTLAYNPNSNLNPKPSDVQILRNFENAVQKLGGTVVAAEKGRDTFKLNVEGKEVWVEVWAEFTGKYGLYIVQKEAMAQDVVADAAALSNDLRTSGHAAVYGIYFDTGNADIKPESAKAIAEIAKMLKGDAGLKVYVVGHTDNVGGVEANVKLSQDRAAAVMQALARDQGVEAARLKAYGCGPFAPVASNDSDEGRGKNRRVELVKQ